MFCWHVNRKASFGHKMEPKIGPKTVPHQFQNGLKREKTVQVNPKSAQVKPTSIQVSPKAAQVKPKSVQVNPKPAQVKPKTDPKSVQIKFKIALRAI